jgi:hypothetical protein
MCTRMRELTKCGGGLEEVVRLHIIAARVGAPHSNANRPADLEGGVALCSTKGPGQVGSYNIFSVDKTQLSQVQFLGG